MYDVAISRPGSDRTPLVEGINWRVEAGDYWIVFGLQGSGKTNFLATAAGLQRPVRGTQFLFGKKTSEWTEEELVAERLQVGVIFENGGRLFNRLTIAENISLPMRYHLDGSDVDIEKRTQEWLEVLGLTPFAHHTPGTVSHVWRQRAALGRALVLEPELLLFDNPIAGMDPRQTKWWFDFLGQLSTGAPFMGGKPVTLVVAVGNLEPWVEYGRQFALLNRKQWRVLGTRDEFAPNAPSLVQELMAAEHAVP
jgi:putative ABC transport system ATP-binding protein